MIRCEVAVLLDLKPGDVYTNKRSKAGVLTTTSASRTITPTSVKAQDELQFRKLADRRWVYAPYYGKKYREKYVTLQIGQNSHENEVRERGKRKLK